MEWLKELWPYVGPALATIVTWIVSRRMQIATIAKTEAEAQEVLARAQKILAESESIEANAMGEAFGALKTLYDARESDIADARKEAKEAWTEAKEANARAKSTERLRIADRAYFEDLLALAITYIDTVVSMLDKQGIVPPSLPQRLREYMSEHNGKER